MARITGVEVTSGTDEDMKGRKKSVRTEIRFSVDFTDSDNPEAEAEKIHARADRLVQRIRTAKRMAGKKGTDANGTANS